MFLSPKRMFSSAVPLSFIIDAVRYCWTREFPVVFVGKHRTSFVVLVKDAYNSHNSFSLTAKLSIIRGLGMFPNKHFPDFPFLRRAGKLHLYRQMPSLPSLSRIRDKNSYPEKMVIPKTSGRWRISNISSCFFRDNFLVITKGFFIQQILPEQNSG